MHTLQRINKSEKIIKKLPETHQRRLKKYTTYFAEFRKCLEVNNDIVQLIIKDVETMFENVDHKVTDTSGIEVPETNGNGLSICNYNECAYTNSFDPRHFEKKHKLQHDVAKVQTVLKNLVRDWSDMGAVERDQCYKPIIDEILERFPADECPRSEVKVLVPGAGLGRLAWEVANHGYTCQGNEFSLFMLFASNFILNKCPEIFYPLPRGQKRMTPPKIRVRMRNDLASDFGEGLPEKDYTRLMIPVGIATGAVAHIGGSEGFAIGRRSRHNFPWNIGRRFLPYKALNLFLG
ncbi:Carnosine N-methyltransferase [Eumeta japonica]|uniref:carnosine N-methyltransferase n=1 Tax=Eumeta variegata TaxID=151549 RepID=A0A4C1Y7M3_EUMVA|nr:Carnosine N-methyltransferase [Eumeta japonica]